MERRWLKMMWWSGALGLLAVVHLGRAIAGVAVSIGNLDVPIWVSVVVGLATAAGALGLWWAADEPARLAHLQQPRRVEEPRRPGNPEAPDAHQADVPCGLHAVVTADQGADFVDEDG